MSKKESKQTLTYHRYRNEVKISGDPDDVRKAMHLDLITHKVERLIYIILAILNSFTFVRKVFTWLIQTGVLIYSVALVDFVFFLSG